MKDVQIHWFSITNSIVVVLCLTGFLALITVRAVRRDIANYNRDEDYVSFISSISDPRSPRSCHSSHFFHYSNLGTLRMLTESFTPFIHTTSYHIIHYYLLRLVWQELFTQRKSEFKIQNSFLSYTRVYYDMMTFWLIFFRYKFVLNLADTPLELPCQSPLQIITILENAGAVYINIDQIFCEKVLEKKYSV